MRDTRPDEWADAVTADRELRAGAYVTAGLRALCYMHPDRVPLNQVVLTGVDERLDPFDNECEGLCGV